MNLNEHSTTEETASSQTQGSAKEQFDTKRAEATATASSGSTFVQAITCELRTMAHGIAEAFKAGGEDRSVMIWTLISGLFLFIMISYAVWPAAMLILHFAFGLPTEALPGFIGVVIGVMVPCVMLRHGLLTLLALWAKGRYEENREAARYAAAEAPQEQGAADAFFAAAVIDSFASSGSSSPECTYTSSKPVGNDGAYGSSTSDDTWWRNEQRKQNEYFHRKQAEQAEYGGYSWDANYHRNKQQQYRS